VKFIGEPVVVESDRLGNPSSMTWREETRPIRRILQSWQDFHFSPLAHKKTWRTRRHRNHYRVEWEDGRIFELYCDRGTHGGRKSWVLLQELDPASVGLDTIPLYPPLKKGEEER
jgi:hypothetical protein